MTAEARRTLDLFSLAGACMKCTACGTPHQTPPVLGVFPEGAEILVIGQNPGEIKGDDEHRNFWVNLFSSGLEMTAADYLAWYSWDFMTSGGYKSLSKVLEDGWLTSGRYAYTNAVRCRTAGNATPEQQMVKACSIYTRQLVRQYRGILLMGRVAINQVFNDPMALEFNEVKVLKGKVVMAFPHYAAWRSAGDKDKVAAAVVQFNVTFNHLGARA